MDAETEEQARKAAEAVNDNESEEFKVLTSNSIIVFTHTFCLLYYSESNENRGSLAGGVAE